MNFWGCYNSAEALSVHYAKLRKAEKAKKAKEKREKQKANK